MKKLKRYLSYFLTLCIVLSLSIGVDAASMVDAKFNPSEMKITVNANASGNTVIRTISFDISLDSAAIGDFVDFEQIYADGTVSDYKFSMPSRAPYGKYIVYVNDGTPASGTFLYYNPTVAETIVTAVLNSKTTPAALYSAISSDASSLGLDVFDSFFTSNASKACDIIVPYMMPFANLDDFVEKHTAALAMSAMNGAERTTIETLLEKYSSQLDINIAVYNALNSSRKEDVCSLLAEADFKSEFALLKNAGKSANFKTIFSNVIALSAVRTAPTWSDIKSAFETYPELKEISNGNSSYRPKTSGDVFTYLSQNGDFSSYESLKQSFDSAVKYVNSKSDASSVPSTRPSVGPSISMPSGNVISKNEYDDQSKSDPEQAVIPTSYAVPNLSAEKKNYPDVAQSSWEYEAVATLGANGVVSGYADGNFVSNKNITRAEFTKLLVSAFSIKATSVKFSDVSETDWYHPYVSVAAGAGLITGFEGRFNPENSITRQDAAVILYRLSQLAGKSYSGNANFGDIADVSLYALTAVRGLGNAGIIKGDSAFCFNPHNNLTRAEAAQLLYNFVKAMAK